MSTETMKPYNPKVVIEAEVRQFVVHGVTSYSGGADLRLGPELNGPLVSVKYTETSTRIRAGDLVTVTIPQVVGVSKNSEARP